VTGVRPRHGDVGNSTLPPVLSNTDLRAACIEAPIGAQRHAARSRPLRKGPSGAGKCDVPGISVNDPAEVWNHSKGIVTEVRPPPVPVTPPSRKSDLLRPCDAFATEASRPGRLMGVTACQDPHEAPGTPATPSRTAARPPDNARTAARATHPRPSLPRPPSKDQPAPPPTRILGAPRAAPAIRRLRLRSLPIPLRLRLLRLRPFLRRPWLLLLRFRLLLRTFLPAGASGSTRERPCRSP